MTDERGFSLIEAIVATLIATIAVLGLAHSFGVGRGLIDRYAVSRDALAAAQRRMEILVADTTGNLVSIPSGFGMTVHPPTPNAIALGGNMPATESWVVEWVNDPVDNGGGTDPQPQDYRRVTVRVAWTQAGNTDTVRLWRYFPR